MTAITKKQKEYLNALSLEDLTGAGMSTAMTRGEVIEFVIDHVSGLIKQKILEVEEQIRALDQRPVLSEAEIPERFRPVMAYMRAYFNRKDLIATIECDYFQIERPATKQSYNIPVFRDDIEESDLPERMREKIRLRNIEKKLRTKRQEITCGEYKHALMDRLLQSTEAGRAILQDIEAMAETAVTSIVSSTT
jgi:hypothetical protein